MAVRKVQLDDRFSKVLTDKKVVGVEVVTATIVAVE